jgi:uncharacterized protein (TIGR03437 family)
MRLQCGLLLAAQWAWATYGFSAGFNYTVPDPTAVIGAVAVDAAGNTYLTGSTSSSTFPTTPGVFQPEFGGGQCVVFDPHANAVPCDDAFVVKLDPTGVVVWATYLGGSGNDIGDAIAVDPYGYVYVAGVTSPSSAQTPNTFPTTTGSVFPSPPATAANAFVVRINPAGSQMLYGTYIPGIAYTGGVALAVDSDGDAYVAGNTEPANVNFPTTAGAFQTSSSASETGLIIKLIPAGSALAYATYLGGTGKDDSTQVQAIAVDSSENAYITGLGQEDFPVTSGAFQTAQSGPGEGAFVTKLNAAGSGLIYSTFLGANDEGIAIKLDSLGRAYILGEVSCVSTCPPTLSNGFPTIPGAFEPAGATLPAWVNPTSSNQFLASLSADGSALVYGTYISGAVALDVDASGDAYVAGEHVFVGFPVSAGAFEQCYNQNDFAAEFSPAGALLGATYFGPLPTYDVRGLAVAQNGMVSIGANQQQSDFVTNFLINNSQQQDSPCMSLLVENAANYFPPGFVAAGELVTLQGMGIGPETGVSSVPGANGLLPTELAGVQVFFDELAAPLMYVQSQQINVAVPWEIAGRTTTQIGVVYNGTSPNVVSRGVQQASPGLFRLNYGSGQGAILNADGSINSASNPAKVGDVIALFGTGAGPTSPAGVTGGFWGLNANTLLTFQVTVQIGDVNAAVLYAGAAPGLLSSFFQIDVQVPQPLTPTSAPMIYVYVGPPSMPVGYTINPATVAVQ